MDTSPSPFTISVYPEMRILFKIKPPALRAYAPEGHTRKITTPMENLSGQAHI